MADEPITLRQWTDVVRRARLGRTVKAIALVLATYADADGTRVYPGVARLAVDAELSYNVVKSALAALRDAGLIRLVRRAGAPGQADVYRLTIAADLLDRVEVLSPAQVQAAVSHLRRSKPWGGKGKPTDPEPRPTGRAEVTEQDFPPRPTAQAEVPVDNSRPRPTAQAEVHPTPDPTSAHGMSGSDPTSAHGMGTPRPTPWAPTSQDHDTRATSQLQENSDLDSAGPRARAPARCPHHLPIRYRPDGRPSCALCRRGAPPSDPDYRADVIPIRRPA